MITKKNTSFYFLISSVTVLLLFGGCKKDENNPIDTGNTQTSQIAITIGSGTKPQYSWSGGNVFSLSIVRTAYQTVVVWGLQLRDKMG